MEIDKVVIEKFLKKIASQDNRSTAAPYFYVIRSQVEVPAHSGCGELVKYYDPEDTEQTYSSIEECINKQKEWSEYSEMSEEDKEDFDERMEYADCKLESYEVSYDWKEEGMFLTEEDAESHLKANHYHYSKDAHTYVKHCWRAHELKEFFVSLFRYFEIPKGNLDLPISKKESA